MSKSILDQKEREVKMAVMETRPVFSVKVTSIQVAEHYNLNDALFAAIINPVQFEAKITMKLAGRGDSVLLACLDALAGSDRRMQIDRKALEQQERNVFEELARKVPRPLG